MLCNKRFIEKYSSLVSWKDGNFDLFELKSFSCFCWNSQNINFIQYMIASNDKKDKNISIDYFKPDT